MNHVIIVGAGPAGATSALLLAQHNIRVTLIEKETSFDRVFRGEALMPLGIEALQEMGLYDVLGKIPGRVITSWDMYIANNRAFQVPEPQTELGDRAVRIVSQPDFLRHVASLAEQYPHFELRMGTAMRDLVWEDERVVGVEMDGGSGRETLRADFVLGCDGRGSLVRTRAGIKLNLLPESYDILWFRFPAPAHLHGQTDVMFMGSVKHTSLCYNSFDNHMRYALLLPKGGFRRYQNADWIAEMAEPAPAWLADHLHQVRDQLDPPIRLNVIVGRAEQWHKPGLLLLGDAAHPMSPIRAQGINLALRDVVVMANHLVPILGDQGAGSGDQLKDASSRGSQPRPQQPTASGQQLTASRLDKTAQQVAIERLPEVKRAQTLQLREAQGQTNERLRPIMIGMARLMAPLMGRFAWAKRVWLRQQHDLRFGTADVKLQLLQIVTSDL